MKEYWKEGLKKSGIRALKTVAETAIGVIGTSATIGEINGILVASSSAVAGIVTLLTCIAGIPELSKEQYKDSDTV